MKYQSAAAPLALLLLFADLPLAGAAELTAPTNRAYDDYLRQAEEAFLARVRTDVSATPKSEGVSPARPGREDGILSVPGGLIHHWVGAAFIPRATLQRALAVSSAFDAYRAIYREVIASKLVGRQGDVYQVQMRLKESEAGVSAVLDILSTVRFVRPTPRLVYSITKSDQIREVKNAGQTSEHLLPAGRDSGYLWRASTFTKLTEQDTGVYVEMETIGLSRSFPPMLGWFIEPIARRLGRKSIERSLEEYMTAVRKQDGVSP